MENIDTLRRQLLKGLVIPAHPLALKKDRSFDEASQSRLSRYYLDCGVGGLAVGVHTTQFAIHDPRVGLLEPVWRLAAEIARDSGRRDTVLVAGLYGDTEQVTSEASLAKSIGYDAGLLSLGVMKHASERELLEHCLRASEIIPLFGFYLQPAVGGRVLSYRFWREFCELPNVVAIKVAPFNRYQTLDVVRALHDSQRQDEIALYTGNDDSILVDLCSEYLLGDDEGSRPIRFQGGLLGHWACWTRTAVEMHRRCQRVLTLSSDESALELRELLRLAHQVTDMNAAIFDAANRFHGCIAGIHEVLYRQGLIESNCCLDDRESLSPGQAEEIERVQKLYPHLIDDAYIREWMAAQASPTER
ncbi:dihydrodipicolinate synthase family protein [Pirellulaceae bacterium SH467]